MGSPPGSLLVSAFTDKRLFRLLFLLAVCGLLWLWLTYRSAPPADQPNPEDEAASRQTNSLQLRENEADKTYWAKEILAQACGRAFETLWDSINATTNKFQLLADVSFNQMLMPQWGEVRQLPHGIELREGGTPGRTFSTNEWRAWVEEIARAGWQLDNIEFRHNRFDTDERGGPGQSHFYFAARLTNPAQVQRAMVEGDLIVDWAGTPPGEESTAIQHIDASHLTLKSRKGEPFFKPLLEATFVTGKQFVSIDPLIVYDLDGDGYSEIILAGRNLVYRRTGPDHYEAQPLCAHPLSAVGTAIVADFDGDGFADLLCANSRGLFLFKGSPQGTFDDPPRQVWQANPPLTHPVVLTCGDLDHDGDLDVFLGQYRVPSLAQIIRPHYYDANDGSPAYLLLNDGHGNFTDATDASGLGSKRLRRTYSASLVDLDGDGHLDLVVVSDFAGLDLYKNDGHGHFSDVTQEWIPESHGFGMGHAVADFNADGRLDLLMIGMPSPTVDRLEHLGLWRPYSDGDKLMRSAMTFGNRLYLARPEGGFQQTALSDSIARSGWSWGCSAFDFDNDGFPDVYIANGLETQQSVRDYESEFWLHDVFIADEVDEVTATKYFLPKQSRTLAHGWSYGGYEKNRLFLNRSGESFTEIGHLAGVSLEQDSRNVVADDLDGDGRVDLLVTTLELWPQAKQTLKVYQNTLADGGHWIGFRFRERLPGTNAPIAPENPLTRPSGTLSPSEGEREGVRGRGEGESPVGVRVTIHYGGRIAVRQIVTGDSHRSQHANTVHFGLGQAQNVDKTEIRWVNGDSVELRDLAPDKYYDLPGTPGK